jgi:hypothetical protein
MHGESATNTPPGASDHVNAGAVLDASSTPWQRGDAAQSMAPAIAIAPTIAMLFESHHRAANRAWFKELFGG